MGLRRAEEVEERSIGITSRERGVAGERLASGFGRKLLLSPTANQPGAEAKARFSPTVPLSASETQASPRALSPEPHRIGD